MLYGDGHRSRWLFAYRFPSTSAMFYENLCISKNKGTSLGNFIPKSVLQKFGHGISVIAKCDINTVMTDVGLLLSTPGDDSGHSQVMSILINDHGQLITYCIHHCTVQCDG